MEIVLTKFTVAELIATLSKLPPEAEVEVDYPDHHPATSGGPCTGTVASVLFEYGVATLDAT